jgi:hypothetical protein
MGCPAAFGAVLSLSRPLMNHTSNNSHKYTKISQKIQRAPLVSMKSHTEDRGGRMKSVALILYITHLSAISCPLNHITFTIKQGGQTEPQGRIPDVRTQRYSNYKFTRHYSDG